MKWASVLMLLVTTSQAQEIPTQLSFPLTSQSVNGSSATGNCTAVTMFPDRYQCNVPTFSVVYDGHIPILTGLDGNMWASQLLTINASHPVLVFDFTGTPNFQVRRVEMVVFNCPQWGISVLSMILTDSALTQLGAVNPTLSSCDSLVRVCIPNLSIGSSQAVLRLDLSTAKPTDWIHIAEVGFYGNSGTCPPETFIPEPITATTSAMPTTTGNENGEATGADTSTQACPDATTVNMTQCPSCSTSTTLASVITAITTALLATLIFVLLQIALCKYHPKFTPGKPESAASAGGEELAVYEQVDGGGGGVAKSGPTYDEVGAGKGKMIDLKQNEAYGTVR